MNQLRRIDLPLLTIAVIGGAAMALMSVASFEFFGYVLPVPALALASTVVMAAGLPALKIAARFNPTKRAFAGALWALVSVELVAQYFKAQAHFARAVGARADLAGSDLAAAAADGIASRLLAFVFLASMPFVLLLCVDAGLDRWRVVRSQGARAGLRRFAGVRARFARLRASTRPVRAALTQARAELATLRSERDAARALAVQARAELDRERARPVLSLESAVGLLLEAGAPEATIRTWRDTGRLRLVDAPSIIEER